MKQREKKSETLEVRLPHSKKEAFKAACEKEGITASHAVRTFIDAYLKRSRRMKLKQIAQELSMTLIQNPAKTTGGIGALLLSAFAAAALFAAPSMADKNVQPIEPPAPVYPIDLASQGIGADCTATFDVSVRGYVEPPIEVECTHPGFVESVELAVTTLRFKPKMIDNKPVRMKGVVYPISYSVSYEPDTEEIRGPE